MSETDQKIQELLSIIHEQNQTMKDIALILVEMSKRVDDLERDKLRRERGF